MNKQKNYDVVTENEIGYLKAGEYFVPAIELRTIEVKRLGKYGRMRRAFLQEYNPMLLDDLVLTEQLFPHLYEVQEMAEKRVKVIMEGLLEKNPAPEKEADAMAWTRHMNMLKVMAEEIVNREVIYNAKWNQFGDGLVSLSEKLLLHLKREVTV